MGSERNANWRVRFGTRYRHKLQLTQCLLSAITPHSLFYGERWVPGGPRGLQNRCRQVILAEVGSIPSLSAIFRDFR